MRVVYGTPLVNEKWLDNYTHELLHMSFNCILEHNEGSYHTSHVSESNSTISDVTYVHSLEREDCRPITHSRNERQFY